MISMDTGQKGPCEVRTPGILRITFSGKLWLVCGLVSIPFSLVPMWFVVDKSKEVIGMTGLIVVCLQAILLLIPIIVTEKALKKNFDEFGRHR